MDFPQYGDTIGYLILGKKCAKALWEGADFSLCYHHQRPIGISVFYGALMGSSDPVLTNYMILFANICMLLLCLRGVVGVLDTLRKEDSLFSRKAFFLPVLCWVSFWVLYNHIGHVPVTLSELPASAFTALFAWCYSISLVRNDARGRLAFSFAAGLMVAAMVMLRQLGVFMVLVPFVLSLLDGSWLKDWRRAFWQNASFGIGFCFCLIQVFLIFRTYGDFFFYAISLNPPLGHDFNQQPFVETIAYTIPAMNVYMTKLSAPVSYLTYKAVILTRGIFDFKIPVYAGLQPGPEYIHVGEGVIYRAYLGSIAFLGSTIWAMKFAPRGLQVLAGIGLSTTLGVLYSHTETRYHIWGRIAFAAIVAYLAATLVDKLLSSFGRRGFFTKRVVSK